MVPAAFLSAVVIVLTIGVSAAQAAVPAPYGAAPTGGQPTNGVIAWSLGILALVMVVIGTAAYLAVANRRANLREPSPAMSSGPTRLPGSSDMTDEQAHKAA